MHVQDLEKKNKLVNARRWRLPMDPHLKVAPGKVGMPPQDSERYRRLIGKLSQNY